MFVKYPKSIIGFFLFLMVASGFLATNRVQFAFDFEQFFPAGDEDLKYFLEFKERFEPDDNFLLIGMHREEGVFEQDYLERVMDLSLDVRRIKFEIDAASVDSLDNYVFTKEVNDKGDSIFMINPVLSAQSLLQIEYPIKNALTGFSTIPVFHLEDTSRYEKDIQKIMTDERLVNNFISEDQKTIVVMLKTIDNIPQGVSNGLIDNVKRLLKEHQLEDYHLLGRSFFQTEIVRVQVSEFLFATSISGVLVMIVMIFLFKRFWGVVVAMVSIVVGMTMFVGFLGLFGRTLDSLALLYPIIMIIVATSDVIHVMSKYIDELKSGKEKVDAIQTTIKEIGMSIFLTSSTTAIGFISLVTSRLIPIREFGINAAAGVMIAYVSVIIFTSTLLAIFSKDQIMRFSKGPNLWVIWMNWFYRVTKTHQKQIFLGFGLLAIFCFIGINKITTNTQFINILPKNERVTEDFLFFENQFSGFRPFEIAVEIQGDHTINEFAVIQEIDKVERHYKETYAAVKSLTSITSFYKSINQAYNGNKAEAFELPTTEKQFKKYKKMAKRMSKTSDFGILVSKDKKYTRISAKVLDIGADSVDIIRKKSQAWVEANIDQSIIQTRTTGTGIVLDKNSEYIRNSLLQGLLFAVLVISIIVSLIYRNLRMLFITLIPNLIPLSIAAALLGFIGFPLEAGSAIVFAIIFGIAIDDTIHILSKFKLTKDKGYTTDEAIKLTLEETGKAICLTTVILFFGFLSLIGSSSPPAVAIGILISATLVSALICDLFIIPILLRRFIK